MTSIITPEELLTDLLQRKLPILVISGDCDARVPHMGVKHFLEVGTHYPSFSDARARTRQIRAPWQVRGVRVFGDDTFDPSAEADLSSAAKSDSKPPQMQGRSTMCPLLAHE